MLPLSWPLSRWLSTWDSQDDVEGGCHLRPSLLMPAVRSVARRTDTLLRGSAAVAAIDSRLLPRRLSGETRRGVSHADHRVRKCRPGDGVMQIPQVRQQTDLDASVGELAQAVVDDANGQRLDRPAAHEKAGTGISELEALWRELIAEQTRGTHSRKPCVLQRDHGVARSQKAHDIRGGRVRAG